MLINNITGVHVFMTKTLHNPTFVVYQVTIKYRPLIINEH